jgi:hypothetical protein
MRKLIFSLIFLFISRFCYCQIGLELVTGLTSGIIKEKGTSSFAATHFSRRYNLHGGFLGKIPVSESSALKSGLIYSCRGASIENYSWFGLSSFTHLKLNYLEIPFLYSLEPGNISFFAGPQYSALVSAKAGSKNVTQAFQNYSVDLRYGIGFTTDGGLGCQVHFVKGLTKVRSDGANWKSNAFTIGLTYALTKSRRIPVKDRSDIPHSI